MVQVLPYVPSFLEQLNPKIGDIAEGLGRSFAQKRAFTQLQKMLNGDQNQQQNGESPVGQMTQQANKQGGIQNLSPLEFATDFQRTARTALGKEGSDLLNKDLLDIRSGQRKEESKMRLEDYKREGAIQQKAQESELGRRESLTKERRDLMTGYDAAKRDNVGGFSVDWLAERLGPSGEPLKSLSGVQLESAMKNVLIDNIRKVGARPNQWIEQQIKSAIPSLGKKPEANQILFEIALGNVDIEEKLLDTKDELRAAYQQQGLKPPANFDKLSHDLIKPYAQQVEDRVAYNTRVIWEKYQGKNFLNNLSKVPQGTPLTREKAQVFLQKANGDRAKAMKLAESKGYTITPADTIEPPKLPQE